MALSRNSQTIPITQRWLLGRAGPLFSKAKYGEQGYILQVALVAFLLLLIGTVAFATRAYSGFWGSVFQGTNREARDVAESAISDFQNTMNRVENRALLIKGGDGKNWSSTDYNDCTRPTENVTVGSGSSQVTYQQVRLDQPGTAVQSSAISRFTPSTDTSVLKNLDASDSSSSSRKMFRVESIQYLDSSRNSYSTIPEALKAGATRGLLRVSVVGQVTVNGVVSTARVIREFEVVPKCCTRSFGSNVYGGAVWGRDNAACPIKINAAGGNGIIGALNGDDLNNGNNTKIYDENGNIVSQAICFAGGLGGTTDLNGNVNSDCASGTAGGNKISYNPTKFDLTLPDYCSLNSDAAATCRTDPLSGTITGSISGTLLTIAAVPSGFSGIAVGQIVSGTNVAANTVITALGTGDGGVGTYTVSSSQSVASTNLTVRAPANSDAIVDVSSNNNNFMYYDTALNQVRICSATVSNGNPGQLTGFNAGTCKKLTSPGSDPLDACFYDVAKSLSAAQPYHIANCRVDRFSLNNGARLYIDTTAAKINLFVDQNKSATSSTEYFNGNGNPSVIHVHCYGTYRGGSANQVTLGALPVTTTQGSGNYQNSPCNSVPAATKSSGGFFQPCSAILSGCPKDFDLAELLNFYSLGSGKFTINGNSGNIGINIYAPNSLIVLNGGGNRLNYMGRLWADGITLNGGVTLNVLSTNPSFCGSETCPQPAGVSLFEYVARSFSHASAY
jgi:hypothetical protein